MSISKSDLIRAGLDGQYDHWTKKFDHWNSLSQFTSLWIVIIIIILGFALNYAVTQRTKFTKSKIEGVERQLTKFLQAEEMELLKKSPVLWPEKLLVKEGAKKTKLESGLFAFSMRSRSTKPNGKVAVVTKYETFDVHLRTENDETVAYAKISAFGSKYVWPYAEHDESLKDGDNKVSIRDAMSQTEIGDFIKNSGDKPVEIIGIGLESSHGGADDPYRLISDYRAQELASAAHLNFGESASPRHISFRAMGLGRHNNCTVTKNSNEEKLQRSALIVAITRHRNEIVSLTVEEAVAHILEDVSYLPVDLTQYEGYPLMHDRLSPPLDFEESNREEWVPAPIGMPAQDTGCDEG